MAKIEPGFIYSLSVDPGLVSRWCKVFSLKPTKPNQFNQSKTTIPLLMKIGDEPVFLIGSHYEGWSDKKKMKIIEGTA